MRLSLRVRWCAVVVTMTLGIASAVQAQAPEHRVAIGASVSGLGLFDEAGVPTTSPGVGAWVTVNSRSNCQSGLVGGSSPKSRDGDGLRGSTCGSMSLKWRMANALPEPDFRYFSNRAA